MPNAPAVTNNADALVRSELSKTSAIYLRLMARAPPKPFKSLPARSKLRLLQGNAKAYNTLPRMEHDEAKSNAGLKDLLAHQL